MRIAASIALNDESSISHSLTRVGIELLGQLISRTPIEIAQMCLQRLHSLTDDRTPPWSPLFGGLKILFSLWSLWSVPGVPVSPGSVPWRPWPPTQPSARDPKPIHSGATMLIHGVQDRPQQALVVAQAPWTTFYKNSRPYLYCEYHN